MYKSFGVKSDGEFKVSDCRRRPRYTPLVQAIKQSSSACALNNVDYKADVFLRKEAQVKESDHREGVGLRASVLRPAPAREGRRRGRGQYVTLFFVPFEEAKQNKSVDNYLKNVGGKNNADGFGAQAWTAGLFFRDVVNNVVKADGDNGLTRARFLEEAAKVHDFTADGMLGPTDVGGRKVSPGRHPSGEERQVRAREPEEEGHARLLGGTKAVNVTFE